MEPWVWGWGAIGLSSVILLAGFMTGRKLSDARKTIHIRKFCAVALIPFILSFLFPPFIYHHSEIESLKYIERTDLRNLDDLSKQSQRQAEYINQLKDEVEQLRTDLSQANEYYSHLALFLLTGALTFCGTYALKRNEEDGYGADKSPLGLGNQDNE